LVAVLEGKRRLVRPRYRWEVNIKMVFGDINLNLLCRN